MLIKPTYRKIQKLPDLKVGGHNFVFIDGRFEYYEKGFLGREEFGYIRYQSETHKEFILACGIASSNIKTNKDTLISPLSLGYKKSDKIIVIPEFLWKSLTTSNLMVSRKISFEELFNYIRKFSNCLEVKTDKLQGDIFSVIQRLMWEKSSKTKILNLAKSNPLFEQQILSKTGFLNHKRFERQFIYSVYKRLTEIPRIEFDYQYTISLGGLNRYIVDCAIIKDDCIILMEYDENYHEQQISKDNLRKQQIIAKLKAKYKRGKFVRIKQGHEDKFFKQRFPKILEWLKAA